MPLPAVVERLAPPARWVAAPALENEPTVLTVEIASTRKSVGTSAVAELPMPSKLCVVAVLVESGMSANAAYVPIKASRANEHANRNLLRNAGRNTVQTKFEPKTGASGMGYLRSRSCFLGSCPIFENVDDGLGISMEL